MSCIEHVKREMTIQMVSDYFQLGEYAPLIEQTQGILGTPFGQVDEYVSDKDGAYLAWKAGYNPRKGKDFFRKLEAQERSSDNAIDVLVRSHPFSVNRRHCLEHYIGTELK